MNNVLLITHLKIEQNDENNLHQSLKIAYTTRNENSKKYKKKTIEKNQKKRQKKIMLYTTRAKFNKRKPFESSFSIFFPQ